MVKVDPQLKARAAAARKGNAMILLPLITAWFETNGEPDWSPETLQMAVDCLSRRDHEWKFARNSPSSGATCQRFSVIDLMRYPRQGDITFRTRLAFMNGDFTHLKWQMVLFEMGILAEPEIKLEVTRWAAAGTCDGITEIPDGYDPEMKRADVRALVESGKVEVAKDILEIKHMAPFRYSSVVRNERPEGGQVDQGIIYGTGAQSHWSPDVRGINYLFEGKGGDEDLYEIHMEPSPEEVKRLDDYFRGVLGFVERRELPPRPYERTERICRWCWHRDRCNALEDKGATTIKPMKGKPLGRLVKEALSEDS